MKTTTPSASQHIEEISAKSNLSISFLFHIALLGFSFFSMWISPPQTSTPPILRVDMVGLPDQLKNQLQAANEPGGSPKNESSAKEVVEKPPVSEPKSVPVDNAPTVKLDSKKPEAKEKPKDRTNDLKKSLDRIKSLSKISESIESDERVSKLQERLKGLQSGTIIKGNQISAGSSLSSDAITSAEASYYDAVRERLRSNFEIPTWLARQPLSALVRIRIDARGGLVSYVFERTSGNDKFDQSVIQAIKRSAPFPVPSKDVADTVFNPGISSGFPQ